MIKNKISLLLVAVLFTPGISQAGFIREIDFPLRGSFSFNDNFNDSRVGHQHEGIDIMADKMTQVVSATDGVVSFMVIPETAWGYALFIEDGDGYEYHYLHLNNDTPGTDDGKGGVENAYALGLNRGSIVLRGQQIGWVGDSGNAENVGSHLHFEIRRVKDNLAINPYESLLAAFRQGSYDVSLAVASSSTINSDKKLRASGEVAPCVSDSLVKSSLSAAVYYCGLDGKRYVFPNDRIYLSWFVDFSNVITLTPEEVSLIPIGGNVTYRPGTRMLKISTDPKVYAVDSGGVLRWVSSPEVATALYGSDWMEKIDDISEAFFINYTVGDPIKFGE